MIGYGDYEAGVAFGVDTPLQSLERSAMSGQGGRLAIMAIVACRKEAMGRQADVWVDV